MKIRLLSSAVASLVLAPLGAFAQEAYSRTPVELDELVVVGEKRAKSSLAALPSVTVSGGELAHRRQGGLGETLAGLPGVRHEWSNGPFSANAEDFRTSSQDRIASYETRTNGYDMLNATFAYRLEVTPRQSAESTCVRPTC